LLKFITIKLNPLRWVYFFNLNYKIMINDREKRMEQRRREYQEDKMVYSAVGTILKIGIVVWIVATIVTTIIVEFIEK